MVGSLGDAFIDLGDPEDFDLTNGRKVRENIAAMKLLLQDNNPEHFQVLLEMGTIAALLQTGMQEKIDGKDTTVKFSQEALLKSIKTVLDSEKNAMNRILAHPLDELFEQVSRE